MREQRAGQVIGPLHVVEDQQRRAAAGAGGHLAREALEARGRRDIGGVGAEGEYLGEGLERGERVLERTSVQDRPARIRHGRGEARGEARFPDARLARQEDELRAAALENSAPDARELPALGVAAGEWL